MVGYSRVRYLGATLVKTTVDPLLVDSSKKDWVLLKCGVAHSYSMNIIAELDMIGARLPAI